ncbi:ABC transporter substrate-binding protein [Oceanidesulfovibrio marinus]|uniref:ABC transporter substrate-binding protein n=1 Tax=Oceanidesulfovibrio marinus TaxID=370038 RepID=A0A6P1ZEQ2_9BACT|nr:ABC transporter substrate-binding protein [Oceanidesulfovibrio marinus]QJT09671.1 ABC transporter substrate-binding protein [Oceanidesulfovibrio marinus]TVM31032.1 ABC transporter substrate-binding protein [Oceanidesulfovibrio marinus]
MKRLFVAVLAAALVMTAGFAHAKTLKLAMDADPVSLDPQVQLSGGMLQYSHLVFDPLIRWTKDMKFEPRLAEKWERTDDLTVRFYLRKGVKFHSGNEFTAKDVAWTLARLKKSADFKGLFEPFAEPKIIDDYTIDIVTKKPYPLLLNMATYIFPMDSAFYSGTDESGEPKDAIVKTGPSFANANESGTGKYVVAEREQGVKTVFKEFDGYWDTKSPGNVDEIILTPIKEDATRTAALLSGDVDFIMPVPPQDLDRLRESDNVKLVTMTGSRIITFQLNQKRREEFKDPKVREAIVWATNNPGIVQKIMKGFATAAGQQSPKGYQGYNPDLTPRYDLEKAKQLMAESQYPDGFTVTMIAPNNRYVNDEKVSEAFVSMMAKIGITVDLKTMPKAQYWDQFDAQVADIQMIGWHADTEDSANFFEFLLMCPNKETGYGQYNSGNYCNADVDQIILDSQSETDRAKRSAMLQKAEKIVYDEAAYVPLHWQDLSWAGKPNLEIEPIVNVMNFPYFGDLVIK